MVEQINQRFPFVFQGVADNPTVYETLEGSTSPCGI
jgi:hypothetical protein